MNFNLKFSCSVFLWVCTTISLIASDYNIGAGDRVEISVGGESDLSGEFEVSSEGTVIYPLLGAVALGGKTSAEVANLIRNGLGSTFLVNPQVTVYIRGYGSKRVAILGDVSAPGFYVLKERSSLLQMLSEAGLALGNTAATIIITRGAEGGVGDEAEAVAPTIIQLSQLLNPWHEGEAIVLRGGDRVFVRGLGGEKVIVSGKVKKPGSVPLMDGMTIMEAIEKAGGLSEFGSLKGIKLVRDTPEGSSVERVDLSGVLQGDKSNDVSLRNGDLLVVPRRWF